jgi:outer membrane beta-barrel protein
MRMQNTTSAIAIKAIAIALILVFAWEAGAQSKQYQRKKKPTVTAARAVAPLAAPADKNAGPSKPAEAKKDSEKLDITDLEQKYWAPKDTDFSVVQNRQYTKAGQYAASLLYGPMVNDPFNSGYSTSFAANYYFDERMGMEFMYISSDLKDSKAVDSFRSLSGGGTRPDFNRPVDYMGFGFNYVPFYAKMSFMGSKIIYFDMQITPHIGMSKYEQMTDTSSGNEESSFSYGIDITQYFFFSKHWAVRANYHNRWYNEDILAFSTGEVSKKSDLTNISHFLMGITYFF